MSELTAMTAMKTARALAGPIGDIGGKWLLAPEVIGEAKQIGFANGFVYYVVGRGGVLGDVDADVVIAGFGFFQPALIRKMWDLGVGLEGPRVTARRFGASCAAFGRAHLAGFTEAPRFVELAERLVDGASVLGLSLFAGWRAEARPDDTIGRAYFLTHLLREWRGSAHVVAAAASGLTPLESILTQAGAERAKLFGWGESFGDVSHLAETREAAELDTDRICAVALADVFDADEQAELVTLAQAAQAAFT